MIPEMKPIYKKQTHPSISSFIIPKSLPIGSKCPPINPPKMYLVFYQTLPISRNRKNQPQISSSGAISSFIIPLRRPPLPPGLHIIDIMILKVIGILPTPEPMGMTLPLSLTLIPPTSLLPISHPRIWNKKPPTKKTSLYQ
jgi:hypothetical protein